MRYRRQEVRFSFSGRLALEKLSFSVKMCYNVRSAAKEADMEFSLKKWEIEMAESTAVSANDVRIARYLRDSFPYPYSKKDAEEFIRFAQAENARGEFYRAIAVNGKTVGGIAITRGTDVYRKSGELGYWLSPDYWNRGVMTAAVRSICEEISESTDIIRIYAEPFSVNAASCRVLEKCGFLKEGVKKRSVYKNGAFYDSILYALVKN